MRFERLNEDKIRITLDSKDLASKNIDYQSFMSNSTDTQKLFLDMLDTAEKEIGFITKDYKIMIEALATPDGTFILTITRVLPEDFQAKKINLRAKRKSTQITKNEAVYQFQCFDDFCNFCSFLDASFLKKLDKLSKNFSLYYYKDTYYLVITNINLDSNLLKPFYSTISEFGKFVNNSSLFERKLLEYGTLIMKNRAIKTCVKYFVNDMKTPLLK